MHSALSTQHSALSTQQVKTADRRCQGFTLIEISIVLAVVGMIIGGIMVGQSMIRQSQINSSMRQILEIERSTILFKEKYGYLPGDMPTASSYWSTTGNGNGNGIVGSGWPEAFLFWQHLTLSGILKGADIGVAGSGGSGDAVPGVNVPQAPLGKTGFTLHPYLGIRTDDASWFGGDYKHALFWGKDHTTEFTYMPFLTPSEAHSLDSKYDDGKPGTGKVVTWKNNSSGVVPNCTTTGNASTSVYNVSYTGEACHIIYIMDF